MFKFSIAFCAFLLVALTACDAQKKATTIENIPQLEMAMHTNTGWHGAQQVDEKGNPVPTPPGYDTYTFSYKIEKNLQAEPIALWVGSEYYLPLRFGDEDFKKRKYEKGQSMILMATADKPFDKKIAPPQPMKGAAAILLVKIDGKNVILPVKIIQTIIPK